MLYVVGGSRIWGYISPPPVIRKQPHKATWAEVLGHHLCITRILILFHGRTSQPRPSLELGVCFLPCLPPCFPSLPPCPSLFLQLFAVVVVVFLTAKKKKKRSLWESRSPGWRAPRLWGRCAGSPPPCRRHSNPPALSCWIWKDRTERKKPSTPFCSIQESKRRLLGSKHSW